MTGLLRLGVAYPQNELGGDPAALRRFAVAAEELGYDHLMMYDHVVGAVHGVARSTPQPERSYHEKDPFHDPLVAFAYLAAITMRIELVTGVLVLPQRQTVLVARQAADVSLLSGGRLRLGVGVGYNPVEYEALGMEFSRRGQRIAEQIPFLRSLWSGEPQTFEGEFDAIDRAAVFPPPRHPIPIWCGGSSEPAFRRAAEVGDGFIFGYGLRAEAVNSWRRVQELLRERNRPTEGFRAVFNLLPEAVGAATVDEIAGALPRLREAGATDVTISTGRQGLDGVDAHIDFLAALMARAGEVLDPGRRPERWRHA